VSDRHRDDVEPAAEKWTRRRPADPFGEVLPDGTRDEDARGWGDGPDHDRDDWLRGEVPPHHG